MLTAINEVEKSTQNLTFEAFASSYEKINSMAYDVLVIGEAVDKIPRAAQEEHPQILGGCSTTLETSISMSTKP
jgi:uncharacterized protein with HEPN domain